MSKHIKNLRLNLDALICISKIKYKSNKGDEEKSQVEDAEQLFNEALGFATKLGDKKYALNCIASLGIMNGSNAFENFVRANFQPPSAGKDKEINLRASKQFKGMSKQS
jgi:hypothetical protein